MLNKTYWPRSGRKARSVFNTLVSIWRSREVRGVNLLARKGEKILLTTDKTRKKLPTSDKKKLTFTDNR